MAHKQREGTPPSRNTAPRRVSVLGWACACAGTALAIAGAYLGLYRTKGFRLPVGFDAPWYVWRASFLAAHGMGPLGTSARPGSAVLAALLGSLTGRSQLSVAVVLSPVLAGCFAVALGAVGWSQLGPSRARWLGAVAVGGTLLGATRLVDENVATLLFLVVLVAALVPLIEASVGEGGRWSFTGSVLLLVGAGLVHQLFLAVFGVMLIGAVVLLAPGSLRGARRDRTPVMRSEAGTLASAGLLSGAALAVALFGVLRAPADTIQLKEDPSRFLPKLSNDAARLRLWLIGPVGAVGAWALARGGGRPRPRRRVVLVVLLTVWAAVAVVGVVFGMATKKLPPHRFLELLVMVPGVVAVAEAVAWVGDAVARRPARGRSARGRSARTNRLGVLVAGGLVVVLAIPGLVAWYSSGAPKPWIDRTALDQLAAVARWSETLPAGRPFVVLVTPYGPAGTESPALKERTVRAALPADRQEQAHVFVGTFDDLLAGRQPTTPNPAMNAAILPYWRDVESVLASDPPVVIVGALALQGLAGSIGRPGVQHLGPGSWAYRANLPRTLGFPPYLASEPADAFPGVAGAALWAVAFLVLLWLAGIGWTVVLVGGRADPPVVFGLAPAVGAAALIVVGSVVSRAGAGLGGMASWIIWAATGAAGMLAARPGTRAAPSGTIGR